MRAKASFNWGLIATGAIVAAILTTGTVAIASSKSAFPKGTIYACVTNDFGTLNLSSARAKCPAGQRKIAWNVRGKRGVRGVRGAMGRPGAAGQPGPAGAQGSAGQAGARGPVGEMGSIGPTGASGAQGIQGPPGADGEPGPKGDTGEQGSQGPRGDTGPAGPGYAMTASSPIEVTSLPEGVPGLVSVLPLSGMATSSAYVPGGPVLTLDPNSEAIKRVQLLPPEGKVSSISAWYTNTMALPVPNIATLRVTLYMSENLGTTFYPVPGASCELLLPAGPVSPGETASVECLGYSIPIASGATGVIVAELSSPILVTAIQGQLATSIGFS